MGRYYRVEIGTVVTGAPAGTTAAGANPSATAYGGGSSAVFTNRLPNGKPDPGAQMVELDLPVTVAATPTGQASVKIWGVSLNQIAQASNFNNAAVAIHGGMQPGLPLANRMAPYSGLLVRGYILQAFGNWMGLAQSLDLVISTDGSSIDSGTQAQPVNISFAWKKGTPLKTALQSTLSVAYPKLKLNIEISDQLVLPADEHAAYPTFNQFADFIKRMAQGILGPTYPGVDMVITNQTLIVFDGITSTGAPAPKQLDFIDLIGQPTWIGPFQVQFSTVMRADIGVGDTIKFPRLSMYQTATTAQSTTQYGDRNSTFTGAWQIQQLRHVGNSRDPDGMRWITSYFANAVTPPAPWTQPQNSLSLKATSG